ncbi:MAG: formylglycine-generating enzyme family protein [Flavobacteriaceae bacterium]|nr:formylglycine-generating enzyme family protein [Flavobacteriaceae bacterium]
MRNFKNLRVIPLVLALALMNWQCNRNEGKPENSEPKPVTPGSSNQPKPEAPKPAKPTIELETVLVEGGTFMMGSPEGVGGSDERPQHQVTLSSFSISKYEVTNAQFAQFLNVEGNPQDGLYRWYNESKSDARIVKQGNKFIVEDGYENHPVTYVTRNGAKAFAKWVGGKLPTEAQWEYAARGGQKSKNTSYSGSDNADEVSWNKENSENKTHPIGLKTPNELGIHDMSGNVWEWTLDLYDSGYKSGPQKDPKGPDFGFQNVIRGGSFKTEVNKTRVAYRNRDFSDFSREDYGFRVVFQVK